MLGWFKKKKKGPVSDAESVTTAEPVKKEKVPFEAAPFEPETEKKTREEKKNLFSRLSKRLSRTRSTFTYQLDTLFLGKREIDNDLLDDLEEILITADLGVATTQELLEYARRKVKRKELTNPAALKDILKEKIKSFILDAVANDELKMPDKGPFVIMVIGVNGVGKTTTIGKIAHKFQKAGESVMLV